MGMYLGKEKVAPAVKIEVPSMRAYLEAGGKCAYSNATTFEGCWQASDWENVTDCSDMFYTCRNLKSIPMIDTSNVTNMQEMFSTSGINSIPEMDTSKVTNMKSMFASSGIKTIPAFNTSNVTDMGGMFKYCYGLTSIPAMDTSKVTNMGAMFYYCNELTSVPALNTSNVTDMSAMFFYCSKLTSIPAMDTSKVADMSNMFVYCSNLETIHMHGMKVSFSISASTRFTRDALVEILNNLATVTTSQTLTMGSTNLSKLTDADKAIATGKGWTLK